MKKYLLIVQAITFCSYLHAQQSNNLQNYIDCIFSGLSYDSIPTKILLDKSMSAKTAIGFVATNDSISDFNSWYALYKAAKDGSENRGNFWQYLDFREEMKSNAKDSIIPIFILNYKYERLKPYVLDSNLLSVLGKQLFDVAGRTESPYSQHRVFNACSAFKVFYGTVARFIIDSSWYFTNDNTAITKIEYNWGDGIGYRTLNWGDTVSVSSPQGDLYGTLRS